MRVRTQSRIAMLLFVAILFVVAVSVTVTGRQVKRNSEQERIAYDIAQGANELGYLSNDYLIYREHRGFERWQARFASFTGLVESLYADRAEQQALVRNIEVNQQRLKEVFDSAITALGGPSPDRSAAIDPALFQASWSRLSIQIQALISDASRLSQLFRTRAERLKKINMAVAFAVTGIFGAYILMNYLIVQRRTLKSIATLQAGTAVIGSGNLDFVIEEKKNNDEIGDLSRAFNQMAADLKTVTASKADLEREIAERKQAEDALRKSEGRLRRFYESGMIGVLYYSLDGRVTDANDKFLKMVGYTREDLHTGRIDWARMTPPEYSSLDEYAVAELKATGVDTPYEKEYIRKDGSRVPIIIGAATFDGAHHEGVAFVLDIGERKRMEEELRRSRDELELRVQERTGELKNYMARLEESNQALQDFASIAAHDLQEPLRKVKTFGSMVKQKFGDSLGEQGNSYMERVLDANRRMESLLAALLEYSRLSTRGNLFVEVDLAKVVREVLSDLEVRIQRTEGEVLISELPLIQADPTQMRQLFQNLIGNALKFHKDGEKPVVSILSSADNGKLRIVVEDNGIGFEQQYLEKIFAPFQRLHSRSEYEGTGMGLAICKKIVERHGGSITAKSAPGSGASFIISLSISGDRNCP